MNNQTSIKYLNWALKGVLYLILVTPLLVSGRFIFPFITTKTMFFRLAVELALMLYVTLAMLSPKFRPRMTKLTWAVIIFGVIIFVTGITGVDFYKTFWGTIERGEGFLTILHLIIYFLILTWTLQTKKEWLNYLTGAVAAGLLVDSYAIAQRAQAEQLLWWRIIHTGEGRLSATIGNAAFLGAFTLAQFFLSLLLFLKRKQCWWKIFLAVATLINFYVLFQTQTRGALLAFALAIFGLSLLYAIKSPDKLKKKIGVGVFIFVILTITTIWLGRNSNWVQNINTLRRFVNISITDVTTESRLLAINTSWQGWQDRFMLGYGWENYNIAFNKYFPAEIFRDQGSQLWFDRAHNTFFDVAVATGIFGLISYLTIFGLALYYLFKNLKYDFDFSAILIALLTAHFIQNIFVFDVLASYIILFTTLAVAVFIRLTKKESAGHYSKTTFNILTFASVLIVLILAAYIFNIKPSQANYTGVKALIAFSQGNENQAIDFFQSAIDMNTYQTPELRQKLADNILTHNKSQNGLSDNEIIKNFDIAIKNMRDNIEQHPQDVQNYLYLMAVLNRAGRYTPSYYQEIIDLADVTLALSPTRPQTYYEIGQAYINQKKYEQGIQNFKQALELNPKTNESHWNLMAAYILSGYNDLANQEYEYLGSTFDDINSLERLFNIYLTAGQKDKYMEILKKIIEIQPLGKNYARLAAAYYQSGQIENAKQAVIKAVGLDQSLKSEAERFLQMLDNAAKSNNQPSSVGTQEF